jgi:universal stress protein A
MAPRIERILVPIDFGSGSEVAVAYAGDLAQRVGAEVHLVHVLDRLLSPEMGWAMPARAAVEMYEHLHSVSRKTLSDAAGRLAARKVTATFEVREGRAAPEIVSAATAARCDLVVMATHGRSGLPRAIIGSVTEQVLRRAPCPVLVLHSGDVAGEPEAEPAIVGVPAGLLGTP